MAIVIIFKSKDSESELLLTGKTVIGRSSKSDFCINDLKISGKHCMLSLEGRNKVIFTDLGSTNGSFMGQNQIHSHELKIGEIINIGFTEIFIDEKRLNAQERIQIGKAQPSEQVHSSKETSEYVLPSAPASKKTSSVVRPKVESTSKYNKNVSTTGKDENLLEQEVSSGMTKMLQIESAKIKKKR
jgi:predicted component of type VI protein secretion system